jgi:hypothetical protein
LKITFVYEPSFSFGAETANSSLAAASESNPATTPGKAMVSFSFPFAS